MLRTVGSSIAFAIPSIVIYSVVHLAFWPAQMSPDSLDQWQQLLTWRFDDTHPVSGTLLNWMFYQLVPSPAFVVFAHYAMFALATGYFLTELRGWNVALPVVAATAVLFPLFPPNFFLVTTLWKDVPFGTSLIVLTALLVRSARLDFDLSSWEWAAMGAAGIALVLLRHNGIILSVGAFLMLWAVRPARVPAVLLATAQIVAFVISKTFLLSALAASPQSGQLRTIVALPILAAMVRADVHLSPDQERTILAIAPIEAWKSVPCGNVVPFYFNDARVTYADVELGKVFTTAASLAANHPFVALRQELCMTELFWRPWARKHDGLADAPLEITRHPLATELGLTTQSKIPGLADWLRWFHGRYFNGKGPFNRPALYLLTGLIATIRLTIVAKRLLWVAWLPAGWNCASLVFLIQSQEYRFVWPSIAASLLLAAFAIGAEAKRRHGLGPMPAPEADRQLG
ncbi:hypothetical protein [Hyphomicrobium sp. 99]|uniref:hypothetical protein n=1 Tax=Hyphomicrobium sp. 99 TaxID=1163419 RepID=UPI0005F89199|nr:hypothetical protein [Hyphomicrobium sp. 99]